MNFPSALPYPLLFFGPILIFSFCFATPISAEWWNVSFPKKVPINVSVPSGTTPAGYQILLNVSYDTDMQLDFDDIRFLNGSENSLLPYWIENKSDGAWSLFWVRIDQNITTSNYTIWMYYGNPTVSNVSNGDATFEFFDDFPGTALNTTKWLDVNPAAGSINVSAGEITIASNNDWWGTSDTSRYIVSVPSFPFNYSTVVRQTGNAFDNHQRSFGLRASSATGSRMFVFLVDGDASHITHVFRNTDNTSAGWYGENSGTSRPAFPFSLRFDRRGDNVTGYVNNVFTNSRTVTNWNLNHVALTDTQDTTRANRFDWIFVRKLHTVEPIHFFGNEITFCNCSDCSSCNSRLNDTACPIVYLTSNILNHAGTCIDNPPNFNNKTFDCQGFRIDGTRSGGSCGIRLSGKSRNTIKNCVITEFWNGMCLYHTTYSVITNNFLCDNDWDIHADSPTFGSNNTCAFVHNFRDTNYYLCSKMCPHAHPFHWWFLAILPLIWYLFYFHRHLDEYY